MDFTTEYIDFDKFPHIKFEEILRVIPDSPSVFYIEQTTLIALF